MFQTKPVKDQLEFRIAPPPQRREAVPPHRPGYVWVPGYWDWRNARHSWVVGHWQPERRGCHWKAHRWVSAEGRWYFQPGGWVRDARPENEMPEAAGQAD